MAEAPASGAVETGGVACGKAPASLTAALADVEGVVPVGAPASAVAVAFFVTLGAPTASTLIEIPAERMPSIPAGSSHLEPRIFIARTLQSLR